MKTIAGILLAILCTLGFSPRLSFAQKSFEGTITWSIILPNVDPDPHTMLMNYKDGKVEEDVDMGVQGLIKQYAFKQGNFTKFYLVMEAMKMGRMTEDSITQSNLANESTVAVPTGKKDTIAGHVANEYVVKLPEGSISFWATADVPAGLSHAIADALRAQPRQGKITLEAYNQIEKSGLAPIKIVATVNGEMVQSFEFIKYEPKKLADALFVPPTDIKYTNVPAAKGGGQ